MPGYTADRPDDFLGRLAAELGDIRRQLRELQKPSATQKANAVARLAEAEADLRSAKSRLDSQDAWNNSQDSDLRSAKSRLDSQDAWNNSQDADIQGIWAKDAAQDGLIGGLTTTTNSHGARISGVESRSTSLEGRLNTAETTMRTISDWLRRNTSYPLDAT